MAFDFQTAQRILFGPGKINELGSLAASLGRRWLIVQSQQGEGRVSVQTLLEQAGIQSIQFLPSGEPSVDLITQGVDFARASGCDGVISVGGGSTIDTGKAIAAMLANAGELLDYLEVVGKNQPLKQPSVPHIAIPTTAGTGSEVTRNAVLTVPQQRVKVSLRSAGMLPSIALIDPELSYSMPPEVTAATGMDALTQVFEPFVSRKANWMTDMFCRDGLRCAGNALLAAFLDGGNILARQEMSWTSVLGGLSLANAGLGAAHGFAGPLGGLYNAPHGALCARLLPAVVEVNIRALAERMPDSEALSRYQEAAKLLTGIPSARPQDGALWLEDTVNTLKIPRLANYGIEQNDFEVIIEKARQSSSMKGNPLDLKNDELAEILERSI